MKQVRWGIIGPGRIAQKFASCLPFTQNGILAAVASTQKPKAQEFAKQFGALFSFGSYEEMVFSGEVDVAYVATLHPQHFECARLCLEAGLPVLCEKPLTISLAKSQSLVKISRKNEVFLMEGMWSWFLPHMQQAEKWVEEGRIGDIIHIEADFGFRAHREKSARLFEPELGGGISKDIAIYPLSFFQKFLGTWDQIHVESRLSEKTGVDEHLVFQGKSKKGATFQAMLSFLGDTKTEACIYGSSGRIEFGSQWFRPGSITLVEGEEKTIFSCPNGGLGFEYEADHVANCLAQNLKESPEWRLDESLDMAHWIEKLEGK